MRLLHTSTLKLVNFLADDVPPYAILSHTWGTEEVTFQEFVAQPAGHKAGHEKIKSFCKLCAQRSIDWAWVDSCCINKENNVELSEAINSMFQWYQRSSLCIAYLSDLQGGMEQSISNSAWFTRGWTLQELLAPSIVEFYCHGWSKIGDKISLQKTITKATGIDASYIHAAKNIGLACVAQRMSWASRRRTTREEDAAYCLLGLFRVNMPLLYGEGGTRAFLRLQEEIMKFSADQTIFA
ncbi:HET-domain-containing protein [Ophiobolus disseminans]|uniref:HET-domain-containing protein n=1 Tax=Ophiobolus disseminans TaxID=1469910 RepID=A0A6A6ZQB1_9PLEO|nr:HET-domain-containing protein [Ophiobolus disseminans]